MNRPRLVPALVALLALAGCDGAVNETHSGTLTEDDEKRPEDDSYFDTYTFRTQEGYALNVEMSSTDFDTYLMVVGPSGQEIGQNDDIVPGQNTNSRVTGEAPESGTYTVFANSYEAGQTGAYQLSIQATEPGAAQAEAPAEAPAEGSGETPSE